MSEESSNRGNFLAVTLVVAVVFQIFLSAMILVELRNLSGKVPAGGAGAMPQNQGLEVGTPAPAFHLRDTRDQEVSLADFRDRKVMLVFSSDQCGFCKKMYPELKRVREDAGHRDVEMVMLQLRSTTAENRNLILSQGFDFPVLAADQETFLAYNVHGTPFSTMIDELGVVTATGVITSYEQMAGLMSSTVAR